VDAYLAEMKQKQPEYTARVTAIAREALGTPYHDGPLGEGAGAQYDPDPLIDLGRVDCVTYVEQVCALALGDDYEDAVADLQKIRYKDGKIDFETRNHFMISDWAVNNPWCHDVSQELGVDTVALTRTISKREFFPKVKAPELGQNTPDQEVTIHYIPIEKAAEVEEKIPSPAIVVFIGKIDWLFALHCGLQLREDDGKNLLYQASSKAGKVINMPLSEYANEQASRYLGFTVYAIEEPRVE
jgi:D-alanyl-D-alanine carboxypeptidase/D-alanyl-D-alanine-endopeptidase (penicillin-binding protein 4)